MLEALYTSLKARSRPEDVAQIILDLQPSRLTATEWAILSVAARGSLKRQLFAYTSMAQEFVRPVGMQRQVSKAQELFPSAYALTPEQCDDPEMVEAFVSHISAEIHKTFGSNDFKGDRLNREARQLVGLDCSRRRYNKLFRLLARMESKLHTLVREWKKREYAMIAKTALVSSLPWEEFAKDVDTACFIAYFAARCNLRSEFTIAGQQRPYDQIADMLFQRCLRDKKKNVSWWAIAHVFADSRVYTRLSEAQKGEMIGRWFSLLQEIAGLLKETWDASDINQETMVVRRGNDSSTWNQTAGAWNKARDHWISLLYALGMEEILATVCPGKALRLMAGDVADWHRSAGDGLDSNTLVWRELPLPWEVLTGDAACTLSDIEMVCAKHGIDPVKTGWIAPRPETQPVAFRATPELVHGVTVGNPFLATVLRKAGFFSGKKLIL